MNEEKEIQLAEEHVKKQREECKQDLLEENNPYYDPYIEYSLSNER